MQKKSCASSAPTREIDTSFLYADLFAGFNKLKEKAESDERNATIINPISSSELKRPNRKAALSFADVSTVKLKAGEVTLLDQFNEQETKLWEIIQAYNHLAQDIQSSDLPSDDEENTVLVKATQDVADNILNDQNKSWLDKILEVAILTKREGFGNCQEKAFFGFAALILESKKQQGLISSLRLATFDNHFIVIVNEAVLMDPWLNLAFPLYQNNGHENIKNVFAGFGNLVDYFTLNSDGHCVTYEVTVGRGKKDDECSTMGFDKSYQTLLNNAHYFGLPKPEPIQTKKRPIDDDDSASQHEPNKKARTLQMAPATRDTSVLGDNPGEIDIEIKEQENSESNEREKVLVNNYSSSTIRRSFSSLFPIASPSDGPNTSTPANEPPSLQYRF